uniref:Glycoprotein B n=1 Tax=Hymenolepis diminuta TaxID=6216 RepID=A0A0R3S8U8_HYMDI
LMDNRAMVFVLRKFKLTDQISSILPVNEGISSKYFSVEYGNNMKSTFWEASTLAPTNYTTSAHCFIEKCHPTFQYVSKIPACHLHT